MYSRSRLSPERCAVLAAVMGAHVLHEAGRVRTYELAPERLKIAEDWLGRQHRLWERRLDQLDSYLLKMKKEDSQ